MSTLLFGLFLQETTFNGGGQSDGRKVHCLSTSLNHVMINLGWEGSLHGDLPQSLGIVS